MPESGRAGSAGRGPARQQRRGSSRELRIGRAAFDHAPIDHGDAYEAEHQRDGDVPLAYEQFRKAAALPVDDVALADGRISQIVPLLTPTATPTDTPTPTPTFTPTPTDTPTPIPTPPTLYLIYMPFHALTLPTECGTPDCIPYSPLGN